MTLHNIVRGFFQLKPLVPCKLCEKYLGHKGVNKSAKYPDICTKCAVSERWRIRSNNKRKSNKRNPTGRVRTSEWIACLSEHGYKCASCGKKNRRRLTLDHKLSLANGGSNTGNNIQPLCVRCHEVKDGHVRHRLWIVRRVYRNVATFLWTKFKIALPRFPRKVSNFFSRSRFK